MDMDTDTSNVVPRAEPDRIPRKILVATDFSEGSERALSAAIEMAETVGASIELVYVDQLPLEELPIVFGTYDLEEGGYYAWVGRNLAGCAARVQGAGIPCRTTQLQGRPAAEIVRHATDAGADLIVVGTHGRTGLAHVLLGSVAERIVRHARCSVLAVPAAGRVG